MTSSIRVGVLALFTTVSVAAASRQIGPPPPLPPPPPPPPGAGASDWTPLVITNSVGDTLILDDSRLHNYSTTSSATISDASESMRVLLKDGDTLVVDDRTPGGTYVRPSGLLFRVLGTGGYPRRIESQVWRTSIVGVDVRSPSRVGALFTSPGDDASAEKYLQLLASSRSRGAVSETDTASATEYGQDGPTTASIEIDPGRRRPIVLTWFAYGSPPGAVPHQKQSSAIVTGAHLEWSAARAIDPGDYPLALSRKRADLLREMRVIGQVFIDPSSGTLAVVH